MGNRGCADSRGENGVLRKQGSTVLFERGGFMNVALASRLSEGSARAMVMFWPGKRAQAVVEVGGLVARGRREAN